MQLAKFFMEYLRVTQKSYIGSHLGSLALDFGGKDTGVDKLYCPCDMKVIRTRFEANGELYLESLSPVLFADGTTDYLKMLLIHDSRFNVSENEIVKQGQYFYDEGGMGSGNPQKFANHVHVEAGKGKWKNAIQFQNSDGVFVMEDQSALNKLFILGNDVIILDDGELNWKRVSDLEPTPEPTPEPTEKYEELLSQYRQLEQVATNLAQENENYKKIIQDIINIATS